MNPDFNENSIFDITVSFVNYIFYMNMSEKVHKFLYVPFVQVVQVSVLFCYASVYWFYLLQSKLYE